MSRPLDLWDPGHALNSRHSPFYPKRKNIHFQKWLLHHCDQMLRWYTYSTKRNAMDGIRALECSSYIILNSKSKTNRDALYFNRPGGPDIQHLPHRSHELSWIIPPLDREDQVGRIRRCLLVAEYHLEANKF
jgi:hypothetical protein